MLSLASTSAALPTATLSLYQFKLQQARREAQQAQDQVRDLQAQTEAARRREDQAQQNLRDIERQALQDAPPLRNTQGQVTGLLLNTRA